MDEYTYNRICPVCADSWGGSPVTYRDMCTSCYGQTILYDEYRARKVIKEAEKALNEQNEARKTTRYRKHGVYTK